MCKYVALSLLITLSACGSAPAPVEDAVPVAAVVEEKEAAQEVSPRDKLLQAILAAVQKGDYNGALVLFDEFSAEEAASESVVLMKAGILVSAGRVKEARNEVLPLIEKTGGSDASFWTLSRIEAAVGNEKAERAALDKALALNARHVPSLVSLGNLYARAKNWKTAAAQFDKALAVHPDERSALLGRADVYMQDGNNENALILVEKAKTLYPKMLNATRRRQMYGARRVTLRRR